MVDFWVGMGILEIREYKIIERTISQRQFENIKDKLIKVKLHIEPSKLSSNYSWIYVYESNLCF